MPSVFFPFTLTLLALAAFKDNPFMLLVVLANTFGPNAQSQLRLDLISFLTTSEIFDEAYFLPVFVSSLYLFI